MEAYTDFAQVYDTFMDETPYDEWADFLEEIINKYGISKPARKKQDAVQGEEQIAGQKQPETALQEDILESERNLVLDLGCGTGSLTERMAAKGYDMIGVDLSQEMLGIALTKSKEAGSSTLYLCQDMRELELYSTVGTVISVCDSVNYLLEEEDVEETFRLVNNYLHPGGIFIFDFNTLYKYEQVIGDTTIAENRDDCSFIWENYYHEEEHINEYDLTIFVRQDEEDDIFRRFGETHYQRGYTLKEMTELVRKAGLEPVEALDADTHKEPTETSERIYIIAREKGKEKL